MNRFVCWINKHLVWLHSLNAITFLFSPALRVLYFQLVGMLNVNRCRIFLLLWKIQNLDECHCCLHFLFSFLMIFRNIPAEVKRFVRPSSSSRIHKSILNMHQSHFNNGTIKNGMEINVEFEKCQKQFSVHFMWMWREYKWLNLLIVTIFTCRNNQFCRRSLII